MSFPPHGSFPTAVPLAPPPAPPHVPAPPPGLVSGGVTSPPPVSSPPLVVTPLAVPLRPSETLKLPALKDPKAYLDVYDMILYWFRQPEYGTLLSDESLLVTTPSNVAASNFWEGQIRSAVREGSLWFLFDNKGTLYHGKGFEMLAVLNQHCRSDRIANAFIMLMSRFNDVQGQSEPVLEFRSRFDGMVLDMSRSKIILPPIHARVAPYPSCNHVSEISTSPSTASVGFVQPLAAVSCCSLSMTCSDSLPSISKALQSILSRLSDSSISPDSSRRLTVADSGATNHMFPDKSAFISYKSTSQLKMRMGNNSYLPVIARGSAIISLNGQRVLVRNALHVPGLAMPLYSLRANFQQPGCSFLGTNDVGMVVYFPSFVLSADTSSDCTLFYEPLGWSAPLLTLHYVQPRCHPSLYPSELSPSSNTVSKTPALLEDDASVPASASPAAPLAPPVDLPQMASQLQSIAASVLPPSAPESPSPPVAPPKTPVLLSTMSSEEISRLLHHPDTSFSDVCLCDTANASDTKTHWSSEEFHRIMGCRKFCNYKHILDISRGGEWIDGSEFPMSLGSFATIPKAKRGTPLDRTSYRFLDAIHMDIAFGDCVSVGGYHYALVLIDCVTQYNWAFGLKTLSSECILAALCLFCVAAGSLARCFYCDCDPKLVSRAISDYLVDNFSKVVAAPAKHQSSNSWSDCVSFPARSWGWP